MHGVTDGGVKRSEGPHPASYQSNMPVKYEDEPALPMSAGRGDPVSPNSMAVRESGIVIDIVWENQSRMKWGSMKTTLLTAGRSQTVWGLEQNKSARCGSAHCAVSVRVTRPEEIDA